MTKSQKYRCAIYTRKSTEEGLDQEYNSLDAQRDAGEAYIKSQQHEGWQVVKGQYDDGGYSGGNMDRPGLKQLIQDIEAGKIDVVVVYKIDRLTRALMDFSKLIEVFDRHNVTFVSVTQSFNTTTSMGRLTLNVLLSFAQFEREVTGERIRDKFASSLKKGIWMGGMLMLGYDAKDRRLVIKEDEAEQVRWVFNRYLEIDSTYQLLLEMKEKGIKTKSWVTTKGRFKEGKFYTKSTIYNMLRNPIYIGKITHRKNIYEGEHDPIIDLKIWESVQDKLLSRRVDTDGSKNKVRAFLLRGKIFDEVGNCLTTSYSTKVKNGVKRFIRYYINKENALSGYKESFLRTLSANEAERIAGALLREQFRKYEGLFESWHMIIPSQRDVFIQKSIKRFDVSISKITINFIKSEIDKVVEQYKNQDIVFLENISSDPPLSSKNVKIEDGTDVVICSFNYKYKTYGGKKIITDASGKEVGESMALKNKGLIQAIIIASQCHKMLKEGSCKTIVDLAKKYKKDRSYISKILKLHYLSPQIKEVILDGQQPKTLTLLSLLNIADHVSWEKQISLLNIEG